MPKHREEAFVAPTGWRVSLDFFGTRLVERDFRGEESFSVGEDSEASLVLPGLGGDEGRAFLTQGDWLLYVEGLAGDVTLAGQRQRFADFMVDGAVQLRPGDSARLHLKDQPDVVLKLRLEPRLEVGWGVRLGLRELAQQLALGGGLAAVLAVLVQTPEPVPEVEMEEDRSATESSFERVLFASLAEIEVVPPPPVPVVHAPIVLPEEVPPEVRPPVPSEVDAAPDPPQELPPAIGVGVVAAQEDVLAEVDLKEEADPPAFILRGGGGETPGEMPKEIRDIEDEDGTPTILGALGGYEPGLLGMLDDEEGVATDLFAEGDGELDALFGNQAVIGTLGRGGVVDEIVGGVPGGVLGVVEDAVMEGGSVEVDPPVELLEEAPSVGGVLLPSVLDEPDAQALDELAEPVEMLGLAASEEVLEVKEVLEVEEATAVDELSVSGAIDLIEAREGLDGENSHNAEGGSEKIVAGVAVRSGAPEIAPIVCEDPKRTQKSQVDVVFVIDVSTTMGFTLGRLEQGIYRLDTSLRALGKDPRYGLVVFVDDVKIAKGGLAFTSVEELRAELTRWRTFTGSNRQILSDTPNRDWPENSLDALHSAAVDFAWRPSQTTARLVVHATDDDFGEVPAIQSGVPVKHTYAETVAALRANQIRVSSFGAKLGGECECLDVTRGISSPFDGSPAIPAATGGAAFDIDEFSSGRLTMSVAIEATLGEAVCTTYPLIPKVPQVPQIPQVPKVLPLPPIPK